MNAKLIAYWIVTVLVAGLMILGGVFDAILSPQAIEGLHHLGYPEYFGRILGVWKVLGAVAILAPGFPILKEWAYAGLIFDVTGASASHASIGDPAFNIATPLVLVLFIAASWWLRPANRRHPATVRRAQ